VVVDRDGELLLGFVLADYILIKESLDLRRLRQMNVLGRRFIVLIFVDDVLAHGDAFITYEHRRTRDQLTNIILTFVAE
jgi:hypothetical protein